MITISEIWNAVRTILNVVSQILGIASIISGQTAKAAQENVPFSIDTNVSIIEAAVTDGTIGLAAIKTAINTLIANQAADYNALNTAITDLPQTGDEVTLPGTFPPAWYPGVGSAVWGWLDPVQSHAIYTYVLVAGDLASFKGGQYTYDRTPFALWPWKVVGGWDQTGASDPNASSPPGFDPETILWSDVTAFDWVTRVHSSWSAFDLGDGLPAVNNTGSGNWYWVLDLPATDWYTLKVSLGLMPQAGMSAPIWPGLAGVTLGSPVSLVDGLVVTGPLQGVIVSISAAAPGKQKFLYGTVAAYQHIGALSFEDDNSDQESFQALEFENQFYLPKSMLVASSVRFKANPGTTGTVTPFTIP